ncbi:LolA-related protein [Acetobacter tropicalis]|jgi:outer membrane lipoprotein-sorting protein|nr:LolA-related protein [Acetobacter tropicalis]
MKRFSFLIAWVYLLGGTQPAWCQNIEDDLAARIVSHLGAVSERSEHFHETRDLAVLTHPLSSSGVLVFRRPAFLKKETLSPRPETLVINGDVVSVEREGHTRQILLTENPALSLLATTLRAPLAGNIGALRHAYHVSANGDLGAWTLIMTPLSEQARKMVREVVLTGRNNAVETLKITQTNGDRQTLMIDP